MTNKFDGCDWSVPSQELQEKILSTIAEFDTLAKQFVKCNYSNVPKSIPHLESEDIAKVLYHLDSALAIMWDKDSSKPRPADGIEVFHRLYHQVNEARRAICKETNTVSLVDP